MLESRGLAGIVLDLNRKSQLVGGGSFGEGGREGRRSELWNGGDGGRC